MTTEDTTAVFYGTTEAIRKAHPDAPAPDEWEDVKTYCVYVRDDVHPMLDYFDDVQEAEDYARDLAFVAECPVMAVA